MEREDSGDERFMVVVGVEAGAPALETEETAQEKLQPQEVQGGYDAAAL